MDVFGLVTLCLAEQYSITALSNLHKPGHMHKASPNTYLLHLPWKKLSLRSVLRTEQCFNLIAVTVYLYHDLTHSRGPNARALRVSVL